MRPSRKHREPLTADNMPKLANLPFARGPPPASVMVFDRRSSIIFSRHRTPGATWPGCTPRSLPVVRRRPRAHIILYYYNTRAFAGHVRTTSAEVLVRDRMSTIYMYTSACIFMRPLLVYVYFTAYNIMCIGDMISRCTEGVQ